MSRSRLDYNVRSVSKPAPTQPGARETVGWRCNAPSTALYGSQAHLPNMRSTKLSKRQPAGTAPLGDCEEQSPVGQRLRRVGAFGLLPGGLARRRKVSQAIVGLILARQTVGLPSAKRDGPSRRLRRAIACRSVLAPGRRLRLASGRIGAP